jgi:hypothetical protein
VSSTRLSKSRFCSGLQCVRQLWWRVHEPDAPELEAGADLQSVFDRGHRIGELAQAEFPGGVLVNAEPWQIAEKCSATRAALAAGAPAVFEASFVADETFVAIDVLRRLDQGFALVEVKSTYSVKPQFVSDVAIQVHVARAAGIDVRRAQVMHLAGGRRRGDGPENFTRVDVTAEVEAFLPSVPEHLHRMREALGGLLPVVKPGPHCGLPYECPFVGRCDTGQRGGGGAMTASQPS